jgi:hypothetical protein
MAEVTYYVALPFAASDDGVAAGEPTECFNPVAVVMRAEALSEVRRRTGRPNRPVTKLRASIAHEAGVV